MKTRYALMTAMLMLATPVAATFPAQAKADWQTLCASVSRMAENAMSRRQEGIAMSLLIDKASSVGGSTAVVALTQDIIIKAYEEPHFSTTENKLEAIGDFRDEWYLECVRAFQR